MRILILGGDGYLGWPMAARLASKGIHDVMVVDSYLKRTLVLQTRSESLWPTMGLEDRASLFQASGGEEIQVRIGDVTNYRFLSRVFEEFQPEGVIHFAEQPSGPYSMIGYDEAHLTLSNNLTSTLNLIWAVMEYAPNCHIVKLGTMGEYGTPSIDIPEGWLEIEHNGRKATMLFPREAGSFYHTTKILDTDVLWFYARTFGLRVTDLMQGPVYGFLTPETTGIDPSLRTDFFYDDIFGTVVNRFCVQAVAGIPLTVYGEGNQKRGYLNILDTVQAIDLALQTPAFPGELRIFNQITEVFSVNELANWVRWVGRDMDLNVKVSSIPNPRKEKEDHYYNPTYTRLQDMGLEPHLLSGEVLMEILSQILSHRSLIDKTKIYPRIRWV